MRSHTPKSYCCIKSIGGSGWPSITCQRGMLDALVSCQHRLRTVRASCPSFRRSADETRDQITRRQVLAAGAAAAAISIVPRHVLGGPGQTPPSEKLNIAGVGVGGQGGWDLEQVKDQNIVALADVDWGYAAHTFDKYPRAAKYKDFREMLDKEKGIDAVVVGTPDHTHAIVSMAAIQRGKHVYCEKPLTRTVYEARAVAKAAREHKVATQMGNQGMAFEGNRLMTEWLADGAIGPVREVHVWSDRPTHSGKLPLYWAQGIERPKEQPPVPATLDWDLWLGPAPWRPYHPAYAPFRWRGWWDFGSGGLGDMGIHNIAPVFSALKLGAPECVYASSTAVFAETLPLASCVHYEFPARARHAAGQAALVRRRIVAAASRGTGRRPGVEPRGRHPAGGRQGQDAGRGLGRPQPAADPREAHAASTSGRPSRCRGPSATTTNGSRPAKARGPRGRTSTSPVR